MRGLFFCEFARILGQASDSELQVSGCQIDSRKINAGELFFALKGETTDGHCYLANAAERGAIGAVVEKGTVFQGLPLIEVDDVLDSMQLLAKEFLAKNPPQIIGITGSVGKTMTKDFIATLLEGKFRVGKTFSSYNSQKTFPLTLLNRSAEEQILALEMGMSEPGELTNLTSIAAPDIALITKVALAHAMNFPDGLQGIAKAKAEIFSQEKTKIAILDHDFLEFTEALHSIRAQKITFSIHNAAADYYLSFAEDRFRIDERGVRAHQFDLPFRESHLLHNFTGSIAALRQLGMQWDEIERQIPLLQLPKMRFEKFEEEGVYFVNDAYNANPASMRAALENLPHPKEGGKKIAILGSMKELGDFSQEAHTEVGKLAKNWVDVLLCLGEEAEPLCEAFQESKKPAEMCKDHESITEKLKEIMRPGDVVLIKGSRSMQMEKILELLHAATYC